MIASEDARIERERETKRHGDRQAARAAQARRSTRSSASELKQGRQRDPAGRQARRGGQGAGAGRACAHRGHRSRRSRCRPSASARWPSARTRWRSSACSEEGEVDAAKADTDAAVLICARTRPKPRPCARAPRPSGLRMLAESEGARALIEAENSRSESAHAAEARTVPPRQAAGDRRADDEAGGEDRKHPHPPDHRPRWCAGRLPAATAPRAPPVNQVMDSILGHGAAVAGAEEHRRIDRLRLLSAGAAQARPSPDEAARRRGLSDRSVCVRRRARRQTHPKRRHGMTVSRRDLLAAAGASALAAGIPAAGRASAGRADQARLGARQLRQPRHLRQADGDGDARWRSRSSTPPAACWAARSSSSSTTRSRTSRCTPSSPSSSRATDKVDVVHGGITSASREAIRQTFRRANTLYFYNVLYEGGVCDRNCIVTGTTPAQAVEPIDRARDEEVGQQGLHRSPPTTTTARSPPSGSQHYVEQRKGSVAQDRFLPARRGRFRLHHREDPGGGPNFVVSALVGGAHMSFYRQWAASGMNKKIPLASTTFGVGNEHLALSAAEGDGILIAGNYSQEATRRPTRTSWRGGRSGSATPRSCTRSPCRSTRASCCGPNA